MERRKAVTTAAAASLTLLAGAAGIALNSGILGASGDDNVGQLSPVNTTTPPITVYVDDPATTMPVTTAPSVQPADSQPVAPPAASGYRDEDGDERDDSRGEERDDERDDEREDEYEGADDDD